MGGIFLLIMKMVIFWFYKNGFFIFKASPCNGIYKNVVCASKINNLILNVDSSKNVLKRSCFRDHRLGHINEECITKHQLDGNLEPFDLNLDDVCESFLHSEMKKSVIHR